jgi:hypothetical protein
VKSLDDSAKPARAGAAKPLQVIYRLIAELKPDPVNPRLHSKKQIRQIANSIEAFGCNVPILIDRDDNVIAGHGRLLACRELGIAEVPTLRLDHLTPAQARAFMIADNRLAEIANWDDQLLAEQLKDLSLLGLDFSIEVTGFEMGEIDLRIATLEDVPHPADDPADAVPELSPRPPVSKLGDLWFLGHHRILCDNALEPAAFAALMGKERAAMVFTDPALQRADPWPCERSRSDPSPPLPDGRGRDGQGWVHRVSRSGLPEPRHLQCSNIAVRRCAGHTPTPIPSRLSLAVCSAMSIPYSRAAFSPKIFRLISKVRSTWYSCFRSSGTRMP